MNNAQLIHQDSGKTDWYTPTPIIQAARAIMGGIDLDPASSPVANNRPGVQIPKIYTAQDDGLSMPWEGKLWMNHPFSRKNNPLWINRIVNAWETGEIEQACMICFASVNAAWFHPLLQFPQFFFLGRVEYETPSGEKANGVTKDSVLTWLPPMAGVPWNEIERLNSCLRGMGYEGVAK